jgi:hypothetical protein
LEELGFFGAHEIIDVIDFCKAVRMQITDEILLNLLDFG